MPVVYVYLGIKIKFYSNDHNPIHFHAIYEGAVVKVNLYVKNGKVHKTTYTKAHGKKFPPAKLKQLKDFVSVHKQDLLYAWQQFFNFHVTLKKVEITKKLK